MTLEQLSAAATGGGLLPCPFCGGPAEVESKRCGWRVHCIKPSCYTAGPYPDDCTEAEAITAWNQRTGHLVAVSDDAIERVAVVADEDAILTIRVRVSHHENELNRVQYTTETHIRTGDKANPICVWDAITQAIAHENTEFLKVHSSNKRLQAALAAKGTGDE